MPKTFLKAAFGMAAGMLAMLYALDYMEKLYVVKKQIISRATVSNIVARVRFERAQTTNAEDKETYTWIEHTLTNALPK